MHDSPFVVQSDQDLNFGDFILALAICSRSYEEARDLDFNSEEVFKSFYDAGKDYRDTSLLADEVKTFSEYIEQQSQRPFYKSEGGGSDSKQAGTPNWRMVLLTVIKNTNSAELEVMNQIVGKVFTDYMVICEINGSINITSDEEIEAINRIQEMYKEEELGKVKEEDAIIH